MVSEDINKKMWKLKKKKKKQKKEKGSNSNSVYFFQDKTQFTPPVTVRAGIDHPR
jgi:hypothetical protein